MWQTCRAQADATMAAQARTHARTLAAQPIVASHSRWPIAQKQNAGDDGHTLSWMLRFVHTVSHGLWRAPLCWGQIELAREERIRTDLVTHRMSFLAARLIQTMYRLHSASKQAQDARTALRDALSEKEALALDVLDLRQQLDRSLQRIHDLENSMTVSPSKSASRRSWADESAEHSLAGASDSRESELTRLTVRQALCVWCVCCRLCLECGRADWSARCVGCAVGVREAPGGPREAGSGGGQLHVQGPGQVQCWLRGTAAVHSLRVQPSREIGGVKDDEGIRGWVDHQV